MLRSAILCLTIGFTTFSAHADQIDDALGDLIAEARAESSASAVVLLASNRTGQVVVTSGEATNGTRFYLASVGKTMVAAAVLNAVDQGILNLDAPLGARVAGLPLANLAAKRTLRDLLSHTSGLPDYLTDRFFDDATARPSHRWTPTEALGYADPGEVQPNGSSFDYSNTNYVLLGAVLGDLDGSLGAALSGRVFGPAKMASSSVGATGGANLARGHDEAGRDVSKMLWNSTLGDGPVVASALDLERFVRTLMESDQIVSDAMRVQMLREGQSGSGYGLGIGVDGDAWGNWYGHSGAFDGAATDFRYYPDDGSVLIVLANGDLDTDWVMDEAATIWFAQ